MLMIHRPIHRARPVLRTIGLDTDRLPAVNHLASLVFGEDGYEFDAFPDIASAARQTAGDQAMVVVASPDEDDLAQARSCVDLEGLPLWAVVAYGSTPATHDAVAISESEPITPGLTTLLRLAMERHVFRRRLQRAQGDLLTLSTRVCHDLRSPFNTLQTAVHLLVSQDLSPDFPKSEISQPALNSLHLQNKLISRISLITEASGQESPELAELSVERAFSEAMDKSRSALDEAGASVQRPESWPRALRGSHSWTAAIWEAMILTLVRHKHNDKRLVVGWRDTESNTTEFWIRAGFTGSNPEEQGIQMIPFNLLHRYRDSRDLGPPVALRLAQLQGGGSWVRVDEEDGELEFGFALPRGND